jgi:hypothetical protein
MSTFSRAQDVKVEVAALRDLVHVSPSCAQHNSKIEIRNVVVLKQRKRICPVSKMLHEVEPHAEEADENEEDNKGQKQNEGKGDRERARREELR